MNGFSNRAIVKLGICFVLLVAAIAAPPALSAATVFTTVLAGANEVPPSGAGGSGNVSVTLLANLLTVTESYTGLTGPPTGAHIHCCGAAGLLEPVAIPFNNFPTTTSGSYIQTFDLTLAATYTGGFLTTSGGTAALAEAAIIAGLNSGQSYANIHTASNSGGEIRGQLVAAAAAPEPTTLVLGGASLLMLALLRRR